MTEHHPYPTIVTIETPEEEPSALRLEWALVLLTLAIATVLIVLR